MTFEERLERLTDRHEALTQAVELLTHLQGKNETLMAQVLESINSLARIVYSHE